MASLERVELVTSKVEGVPDQLKIETSSQHTMSIFVPEYTANTVEVLLDLIYTGQSRSTGKIDPLTKQLNIIHLYKDLGFEPNLLGGLPNIAELDQVPLEMEDLSVGHMHIKKEEYFEEFDLNANNSNEDLRILRTNYDKVLSELENLEVKNHELEEQLFKIREDEASSAVSENGKCKENIEEKEKFKKLFEDSEAIKKELLMKHEITEKRNGELKELNRINKFKVKALQTDQMRLENENKQLSDSIKDLKDSNQTLKKENEAIGIGNKELYKKVEVLNKKIDDLKRVIKANQRTPEMDEYEIQKNECRGTAHEQKEIRDRNSNLKEMSQKSQQKMVEVKEKIDEELEELKKAFVETKKALEDAKADAEGQKKINCQLKKIRQTMRAKVKFAEEENTILKDDLRELLGELDLAVIKLEFNKYSNIFKQIIDKVRNNGGNQAGIKLQDEMSQSGEHDFAIKCDSQSSNVNNDAKMSKKRQSSETDYESRNKFARELNNILI